MDMGACPRKGRPGRLPHGDDSAEGCYFLTFCARNRPGAFSPGPSCPTRQIFRVAAAWKRFTSQAAGENLRQSTFHDRTIRSEADCLRVWNDIDGNPARWAGDRYVREETL